MTRCKNLLDVCKNKYIGNELLPFLTRAGKKRLVVCIYHVYEMDLILSNLRMHAGREFVQVPEYKSKYKGSFVRVSEGVATSKELLVHLQ